MVANDLQKAIWTQFSVSAVISEEVSLQHLIENSYYSRGDRLSAIVVNYFCWQRPLAPFPDAGK